MFILNAKDIIGCNLNIEVVKLIFIITMSGGVYGGDEVGTLVIDVGSNSIRVGFAGEDIPKADFPTAVGYIDPEEAVTGNEASANTKSDRKYFFDTVNLKVPRKGMEITSCLKEGMIEDWDIFERQLDYIYDNYVRSPSELQPVLMTEPAWNIRSKREKLTELMFEKYNIPALFLAKNAVLSAFANGRSTGLVIDSGATLTSVVPVYDGYVVQQGIVKSPLAGDFILLECKKLLDEMNIDVVPSFAVAEKEVVAEEQSPRWKKRVLPELTKSFNNFILKETLRDFAATALQVSDSPYDESIIESMPTQNYEFATGYNHVFSQERFRIPEGLFDPSLIKDVQGGSTMLSMGHIVSSSVGFCDADIKPNLCGNIIVVGGNTLINGFIERLNRDVATKVSPSVKVKVISSPVPSERKFSSWIGGSILGSLGAFQHMWISKQDYDDGGKGCVEKKCP